MVSRNGAKQQASSPECCYIIEDNETTSERQSENRQGECTSARSEISWFSLHIAGLS